MKQENTGNPTKHIGKDISYHMHEMVNYREPWRIFRIMSELVEGYQLMSIYDNEVTIFGSARLKEDNRYYKIAVELGALLAHDGHEVITGGGPGIMEAANRGAFEAGGESIGLNIELPFEQRVNPYVKKALGFFYFFTRKVMMTSPSNAFIFFPGGFGTLDEFFEVVDHIELGKMCQVPIVLVGLDYWTPLVEFMRSKGESCGTVTDEQIAKWHIVDTAEEAIGVIRSGIGLKGVCELSSSNFHSEENLDWRIFRIMSELVEGFEFLTGLGNDVSVLGTKSIGTDNAYYHSAYTLGSMLAQNGYATITGGAEGIAEAANKGAFEQGGVSVGIGMEVHGKARMNRYTNRAVMFSFPFTRKLIITAPSTAFIFYPGGLGTLHHLFEVLTLIQTKKVPKMPVILYDHTFWEPLHTFIKKILVHDVETISEEDDELYQIVDTEEAILQLVEASKVQSKDTQT